jgi:ABC-type nitrate/sulfonate/bicarbonate transport system substrate-binding protein
MQLNWIKNFEFAGSYIADEQGLYTAEGFSAVELLAGGPDVAVEPLVVSGTATMAYGVTSLVASAILEGAALKVVGAAFQINPLGVLSLAESPITTPQDLVGKTIGVAPFQDSVWQAFLEINDIDPSSVNQAPQQFDPAPLVAGDWDGMMAFITNQPVSLQNEGIDTAFLMFGDYGYDLFEQLYFVTEERLSQERDVVVGALRAEAMGWRTNLNDPELGAQVTVDRYGEELGLDYETELGGNNAQNKLIDTPITRESGLFYMSPDAIERSLSTLEVLGLSISADVFTNDVLDEIYADGIELGIPLTAPAPT